MNKIHLLTFFTLLLSIFFTNSLVAQTDCNLTVNYIDYGQAIFPSPLSGLCLPQNTLNIEIRYPENSGDSLKVNDARFAATGSPQVVQLTDIPEELIVEIIGTDCYRFLDVNLPPLPPAPSMLEGDTIFCAGEQLAPMLLSGHANSSFYWTNRDGTCIQSLSFSGLYNEEWTYPITGEFSVYQYIDGKITEPLHINIVEGLQVEVTGDSEFCEGDNARLNVFVDGELPTSEHSITWFTPTGDVHDATSIGTDIEYWYTVEVTNADGCKGIATAFVAKHLAPIVSILDHEPFCQGESIELTAQGLGNNGSTYTYLWKTPAGDFHESQTIEANVVGNYRVTVTNDNGCSTSESILVEEDCTGGGGTVSTEDPTDTHTYALYPNPNQGTFNLAFPNAADRQVTLFNLQGQLIFNAEYTQQIADIDIRHLSLPTGTYIVQVQENGLTKNQKVVIGNW